MSDLSWALMALSVWFAGVVLSAILYELLNEGDDSGRHALALVWPVFVAVVLLLLPIALGVQITKWGRRRQRKHQGQPSR